jgi:excisionase family DNA binding protein
MVSKAPKRRPVLEVAPLAYTVEEVARLLGLSKNLAYEAVNLGQIPSVRIGRRLVVPKAALEKLLSAASEKVLSPK